MTHKYKQVDAIHPPCTARWNPPDRSPIDRVQVERPRSPSGASPVFRPGAGCGAAVSRRPASGVRSGDGGRAFFDLDRTLLAGASGEAFSGAMRDGRLHVRGRCPGERAVYGLFNRIGETLPSMALARQAASLAKGRSRPRCRAAGEAAADAAGGDGPAVRRAAVRRAPRRRPPDRAGHDDAVRPRRAARRPARPRRRGRHPVRRRRTTGHVRRHDRTARSCGRPGKLAAVRAWAEEHDIDLGGELRLLGQLLRRPAAVGRRAPRSSSTPTRGWSCWRSLRRWPILNLDVSPGVVKIPVLGIELQQLGDAVSRGPS